VSRQKADHGADDDTPLKQNDEVSSQSSVEQQGDTPAQQDRKTSYRLPPTGYLSGHEDLAWFTRTAADLAALEAEARARADERGPHGRRFARLRTVIEDALLQARQGLHEARHGQYELAERSRQ
jgi:hypothetical protein